MLFFSLVILHFFPNWHEHECYTSIHQNDWQKIFERWEFLSDIEDFDTFIEVACGLDYADNAVGDENALYLINNNADKLWEMRTKERLLYENLKQWCEMQWGKRYKYITIFGY